MNYQQIKLNLTRAEQLTQAGQVAQADKLIRSMVGKGLTPMDLQNNLSGAAKRALRAYAKRTNQ